MVCVCTRAFGLVKVCGIKEEFFLEQICRTSVQLVFSRNPKKRGVISSSRVIVDWWIFGDRWDLTEAALPWRDPLSVNSLSRRGPTNGQSCQTEEKMGDGVRQSSPFSSFMPSGEFRKSTFIAIQERKELIVVIYVRSSARDFFRFLWKKRKDGRGRRNLRGMVLGKGRAS